MNRTRVLPLLVVAVAFAASALAASVGSASDARSAAPKRCAFTLRIGDVLPFTGDLAAYGANLDRAVKIAVGLQNAALKQAVYFVVFILILVFRPTGLFGQRGAEEVGLK